MPKTKWGSVIFTAYKFFDSKEFLFFVVLEDIHTEGFAAAQHLSLIHISEPTRH